MTQKTIGLGLDMNAGKWQTPPTHIPNDAGETYKTELVLQRVPNVEKIHWWHLPDPRKDPHTHPWPFRSTILSGGYTEHRWTKNEQGVFVFSEHTYSAGDVNEVDANVYHNVVSLQPKTVTHMVCGELVPDGKWGYLNLETMEEYPATKDPTFLERLWKVNPHMRPKT
jgi:hypothetical protein